MVRGDTSIDWASRDQLQSFGLSNIFHVAAARTSELNISTISPSAELTETSVSIVDGKEYLKDNAFVSHRYDKYFAARRTGQDSFMHPVTPQPSNEVKRLRAPRKIADLPNLCESWS
jgi:hypothetical protein